MRRHMRRLLAVTALMAPQAAFAQFLGGTAASLPEGPGRDDIQAICSTCHGTSLLPTILGYDRDGWKALTLSMTDLSKHAGRDAIWDYLAVHFPPNDKRKPTLAHATLSLSFKEWTVPTPGQRARDPVEAPDGSIWWTGQRDDIVGRLDPASGAMKEYKLPTGSLAHSVTPDKEGNIWFTGNGNGTIGKIEPVSGKITVYPMPDKAARDPHTAEFDAKGILWFTAQGANMIGRLDPKTGDIKLAKVPVERARPYGIKIDSKGAPWVSCNSSNCILRIDPETMAIKVFKLPQAGSTVRRLALASDDTVWFVNSGLGYLGRLDPNTGAVKEWPTPSGRDSHPYAIEIIDDIVWFNESAKRPDPLVRFDPKTETFQSWIVPSGRIQAGHIRHMRRTKSGDLLIHTGAANNIIRVTIGSSKRASR